MLCGLTNQKKTLRLTIFMRSIEQILQSREPIHSHIHYRKMEIATGNKTKYSLIF